MKNHLKINVLFVMMMKTAEVIQKNTISVGVIEKEIVYSDFVIIHLKI